MKFPCKIKNTILQNQYFHLILNKLFLLELKIKILKKD